MTPQMPSKKTMTLSPFRLKSLCEAGSPPMVPFVLGGWAYPCAEGTLIVSQGSSFLTKEQHIQINTGQQIYIEVSEFDFSNLEILQSRVLNVPPQGPLVNEAPLLKDFNAFTRWSEFLFEVRHFFSSHGLMEVSTPSLVETPGMESELIPFKTEWKFGSNSRPLFLPTSPEIHLKKMIVDGFSDIFEIKECFRNEEVSPCHEPHFLMLEWYRAFADLELIKEDLVLLVRHLLHAGLIKGTFTGFSSWSMAELFKKFLDFNLTPETSLLELQKLAQRSGIELPSQLDWNDTFYFIFIEKIECHFKDMGAFLLTDYPPSMSALAKINDAGFSDRFEFYWDGIEIANAFNELQDSIEQKKRFDIENKKRQLKGQEVLNVDSKFIEALERGLPQTGGIALGLERLFMVCQGYNKISNFKRFTFNN